MGLKRIVREGFCGKQQRFFSFRIFDIFYLISKFLSENIEKSGFTMEQSEEGYKNFTVIQCNIESIEWLYLAAKGHRRARFDITNDNQNWLIP